MLNELLRPWKSGYGEVEFQDVIELKQATSIVLNRVDPC